MNLRDYPDVLTVKDLMDILRIGKNSAYMLLLDGTIKCHRIGKKYIIPKCCLLNYLKSAEYGNI